MVSALFLISQSLIWFCAPFWYTLYSESVSINFKVLKAPPINPAASTREIVLCCRVFSNFIYSVLIEITVFVGTNVAHTASGVFRSQLVPGTLVQ